MAKSSRKTEDSDQALAGSGELRDLLDFIRTERGFDFSGYKKTSLERRLAKRLAEVEVEDYAAYQDYLQVNPHEYASLFDTILINVTSFFRDAPAWDYLREEIVPELCAGSDVIRVWSAGCATGEEAYSIAMLLAEQLGEQQFRERVKIYATDADEKALDHARHAVYSPESVKTVPPELLDKYFELTNHGYAFRSDLRRSVIFGRNDLVQDAPISRIDLLISRNLLMYFTSDAQARILERLNFALDDDGYLFLGKSEMLITHTDLFKPHNLKWRVFRKVPQMGLRERLALVGNDMGFNDGIAQERHSELRTGAFALSPMPQLVVSRNGFVFEINRAARTMFSLSPADVGRPFQDLELSYRPADLRSAIEQCYSNKESVLLSHVDWHPEGRDPMVFEIEVCPVPGADGAPQGVVISFRDVTVATLLASEHEERKRELETAYEELQSTVEELETTNEELQSTNEELETTNEELQSTNEELETMNEELQSTNDELETMNQDQHDRSTELDRVNMFLEGILTSLGVGVVVIDEHRRVQVWNGDSTELWGLRPEEVAGVALTDLDIGLDVDAVDALVAPVIKSIEDSAKQILPAVNRRGRKFQCYVRVLPLRAIDRSVAGALVLMADGDRDLDPLTAPE